MKIGVLSSQKDVDEFFSLSSVSRKAISDQKIRGLQLERMVSGQVKWRLRYMAPLARGRVCMTLGDARVLSLHDARNLAIKHLRSVALGIDPKQQKEDLKKVPTFQHFIDTKYLPYIKTYKRSWGTDVSLLNNHLLPRFGKLHMDAITREQMVQMHHEKRESGSAASTANRLLIMMRYIFNLALKWQTTGISVNPCKGLQLLEENNKRERYLLAEETQRLYDSLCANENTLLRYIVPMLIMTGARKRELLDAKWSDFDLTQRIWRIPITKSGKARHVPLSEGVLSLMQAIPRHPTEPWLFPNPKTGKPFASVFYAWDTARRQAGLGDVRMHDLRHSFASLLINSGRTLYEVQKILGHTQVKTTERYAHLSHGTLIDAANAASSAVGMMWNPEPKSPPNP